MLPSPLSKEQQLAVQFSYSCRLGNTLKTQLMTVSWLISQQSCVRVEKVRQTDVRLGVRWTSTTCIFPVKSRQNSRQSLLLNCCTLLSTAGCRLGKLLTTVLLARNHSMVELLTAAKEYSVTLQLLSTSASARYCVALEQGLQQVMVQMFPQVVVRVMSWVRSLILLLRNWLYFRFSSMFRYSQRQSGEVSAQTCMIESTLLAVLPVGTQAHLRRQYPAAHCEQQLVESWEVHPGMGAMQQPEISNWGGLQAVQRPSSCEPDKQQF